MNEKFSLNSLFTTGLRSLIVGMGAYFIVTAIFVLIFWFSPAPEGWMTYAGGLCFSLACLAAGLKMGSGIGEKGIIAGLIAGAVLAMVLWGIANLISAGQAFESASPLKITIGILSGVLGGMIGVNLKR